MNPARREMIHLATVSCVAGKLPLLRGDKSSRVGYYGDREGLAFLPLFGFRVGEGLMRLDHGRRVDLPR